MQETLIFSKNNSIPKNKKKLFIGQWLLVDKVNNKKGYRVLKYQEEKQDKLHQFIYVKKIYNRVLRNVTPVFNNIHKKNYKEKDWEILLFYFLYNYIFFAYNKWILIKKLKKKKKFFTSIEIFSFKKNFFVQDDTKNFFDQLQTEKWDDWLFSNIIKSQNFNFKEKKINTKKKKKKDFNNLDKLKLQKLFFSKNNNKYFLKNLALPKILKLKLSLKLNKNFRFYNDIYFKRSDNIIAKRNLFKKIKAKDKFENFIYNTLSEIFPRSYLENFNFIENNIDYLNWPQKPKVIFTSFEHYFNDVFKIYTIKKKQEGAKLYLLQHGHQGLHDICLNYYEKKICDRYYTWGNKSKNKKVYPLFCTTTIGKKIKKNIKSSILLSYTEFFLKPWKSIPLPRVIDETNIYKNDIINLLNSLSKNLENQITLKYNTHGSQYTTNNIKKKIKNLDFISTDLKKRGFEFSNNYKLNIETANSTGFIELLSLNIPVILITNKKFFNVKKEYKIYYDELIKSKIIFFDAKKAADFINQNIDNIDNWWLNRFTQKRIKYFCDNICKYEEKLDKGLEKIFNKIK